MLTNPADVYEDLRPEIGPAIDRALRSGAVLPLTYVGSGMTANVFCDSKGMAFKVARVIPAEVESCMLGNTNASLFEAEVEFLISMSNHKELRTSLPKNVSFDPVNLVIRRQCVQGRPGGWADEYQLNWKFWPRLVEIAAAEGWRAPEFKGDSFVFTKKGPVLVDAGFAFRIGKRLLAYVYEWLDGRRPFDSERPSDYAFYLAREIGQPNGLTHHEACTALKALQARWPNDPGIVEWMRKCLP